MSEKAKNAVKTLLSTKIIDKKLTEWKNKKINPSGKEVEVPHSLDGEILLEEDIRDGILYGWTTITVDRFAKMFESVLEQWSDNPSVDLKQLLNSADDIFRDADLSKSTETETLRIIRVTSPMMENVPDEVIKTDNPEYQEIYQIIEDAKVQYPSGGIRSIKFGEHGHKRYFQRWKDEGLI